MIFCLVLYICMCVAGMAILYRVAESCCPVATNHSFIQSWLHCLACKATPRNLHLALTAAAAGAVFRVSPLLFRPFLMVHHRISCGHTLFLSRVSPLLFRPFLMVYHRISCGHALFLSRVSPLLFRTFLMVHHRISGGHALFLCRVSPLLFRPFLMVHHHISCGHPLFLFYWGVHCSAVLGRELGGMYKPLPALCLDCLFS